MYAHVRPEGVFNGISDFTLRNPNSEKSTPPGPVPESSPPFLRFEITGRSIMFHGCFTRGGVDGGAARRPTG